MANKETEHLKEKGRTMRGKRKQKLNGYKKCKGIEIKAKRGD
jgi:hypothetical protein